MITFTTLHECSGAASRVYELYAPANGVVHGEIVGTVRTCEAHREPVRDAAHEAGLTPWSCAAPASERPCGDASLWEDSSDAAERFQKTYDSREEDDSESGDVVTTDETADTADVETTEDHAAELDALLVTPGTLTEAVRKLNAADTAFGRLDMALRRGERLPVRWSASVPALPADRERVTDLYDRLSEALRSTGNASVCLDSLRAACKLWHVLDVELRVSGALPEPWGRA